MQHPLAANPPPPPQAVATSAPRWLQPFSSASLAAGIAATVANADGALDSCLSVLPSVARSLLDQIDAIQRAKMANKYDIKTQKEIAALQNKPLMYTCPGAAVVSCDGPGVDGAAPTIAATDMSMNQRFA